MKRNEAMQEVLAYYKRRFNLFFILLIISFLAFAALMIFSFTFPSEDGRLWIFVGLALIPFVGSILFGKLALEYRRQINTVSETLDPKRKKKR